MPQCTSLVKRMMRSRSSGGLGAGLDGQAHQKRDGKAQTENQRQCFLHIRSSSDLLRNSRLALPLLCVSSGSWEPARIRSSAPLRRGQVTAFYLISLGLLWTRIFAKWQNYPLDRADLIPEQE